MIAVVFGVCSHMKPVFSEGVAQRFPNERYDPGFAWVEADIPAVKGFVGGEVVQARWSLGPA